MQTSPLLRSALRWLNAHTSSMRRFVGWPRPRERSISLRQRSDAKLRSTTSAIHSDFLPSLATTVDSASSSLRSGVAGSKCNALAMRNIAARWVLNDFHSSGRWLLPLHTRMAAQSSRSRSRSPLGASRSRTRLPVTASSRFSFRMSSTSLSVATSCSLISRCWALVFSSSSRACLWIRLMRLMNISAMSSRARTRMRRIRASTRACRLAGR
mmetsp:Transcript_53305/g.125289  ORF Transcript_53305/g.125289 Transcript_53305/m.125289 type:complete len:212 (-) Transcript_53305:975-1610(-)